MTKGCKGIGKSGCLTSWIVKKSLLKKLIGGSYENCQQSIDDDIDNQTHSWLQLSKVLQNIKGKGIATMVGQIASNDVVVKVQMADEAKAEIDAQNKLSGAKGFIKYFCNFTCDGNKEYIESFSTLNEETKLCSKKGSAMGIIIMPFYRKGALEKLVKSMDKETLKKVLSTTISNYAKVYRDYEFTHGDFYSKNIVLDDAMEPVIIDFEKSTFDKPHKRDVFWNDLDNLFLDLSRNQAIGNLLFDKARTLTIHRAYGTEPTEQVITDLINSIMSL